MNVSRIEVHDDLENTLEKEASKGLEDVHQNTHEKNEFIRMVISAPAVRLRRETLKLVAKTQLENKTSET